jgi:glycine oxidase
METVDWLVTGSGLAGACTALRLSEGAQVALIDSGAASSASSAAVAGLANPLMAARARPVWQAAQALDAFDRLLADLGGRRIIKKLRPAGNPKQAERFRERAAESPDLGTWIDAAAAAERFPWLTAPHGVLHVRRGGAVSIPAVIAAAADALRRNGGAVRPESHLTGWSRDGDTLVAETSEGPVRTRRLVLAVGAETRRFPVLSGLNLHGIKGQIVRVRPSESVPEGLMPVSGSGYVVPDGESVVVGSSYEHEFEDTAPRRVVSRRLLARAAHMLPWLEGASIDAEFAGVRATVPGTRLPLVGPVRGEENVWVIGGLGSKGLLMAPWIADRFRNWTREPESIPAEVTPGFG